VTRPFENVFAKEFKNFTLKERKELVNLYSNNNNDKKTALDNVRTKIKSIFLKINDPFNKFDKKAINMLIFKNRYRSKKLSTQEEKSNDS